MNKIILPIIRKVVPNLIASQITGVQSMQSGMGGMFTMKPKYLTYEIVKEHPGVTAPAGYVIVYTNVEIGVWIEQQDPSQWKTVDRSRDTETWGVETYYIISDELLTLMTLKWA